jgi:hypothetical protein
VALEPRKIKLIDRMVADSRDVGRCGENGVADAESLLRAVHESIKRQSA